MCFWARFVSGTKFATTKTARRVFVEQTLAVRFCILLRNRLFTGCAKPTYTLFGAVLFWQRLARFARHFAHFFASHHAKENGASTSFMQSAFMRYCCVKTLYIFFTPFFGFVAPYFYNGSGFVVLCRFCKTFFVFFSASYRQVKNRAKNALRTGTKR